MSADSPSRSRPKGRMQHTVLPQQVTDPTILDSVAGFINEVVPASYNIPCDSKDQVQWAHFENLEGDAAVYDCEKVVPPPLVLVLGYTTGVQVWGIPANGEAVELFSWRHGSVQVLRFLPAPQIIGKSIVDLFETKRPLIALCDTATPGPAYCSLCFLSLRTGEQVKQIKFKNPVLDVLANSRSVVVTFSEKIAIFDAFTLEDRLTVTTCYISPGIYPNPVALGARWMAYAEKNLIPLRRSSGGNEGEGVQSYTATVLHAAKSLGRGLRELGETVASSLTGTSPYKPGSPQLGGQSDVLQKGIVTILDIESESIDSTEKTIQPEAVVAHFAAHTEAIVCLKFDPSGLLLLTADKRGHDFHLFRIHPHPGGPTLAAVHHLYILHRGDTTARVQDMSFSPDSRWVNVSTLRGTTHVFPVTPYGGAVGVRTHATPHVVNRMSRFQRSAGLTTEGRCNSPISVVETPVNSHFPYHNPRLPPYPHPTVVHPLAQIRQPIFMQNVGSTPQRSGTGRQRLSSGSEDSIQVALRVSACFAPPRAWLDNTPQPHDQTITKPHLRPVESIFTVNCHGVLVQYDLDPHHAASVPKERVCDDTPIELTVCAKAQWVLQRKVELMDVQLPLSPEKLGLLERKGARRERTGDRWLSQVEIITHAGPHRRLWMGPQFTFKTYTTNVGSPFSVHEAKAIDVGRSKPVNMPSTTTYPILIESGSVSSCEQSPKLLDTYQRTLEEVGGAGEVQLKEDLADAMLESPGAREAGGRRVIVSLKNQQHSASVAKVVNPLGTVVTVRTDDEDDGAELRSEDLVIHENCDEALFRPVVGSKSLHYAERSGVKGARLITDTICTKSLDSSTEVRFKIENKGDLDGKNGKNKKTLGPKCDKTWQHNKTNSDILSSLNSIDTSSKSKNAVKMPITDLTDVKEPFGDEVDNFLLTKMDIEQTEHKESVKLDLFEDAQVLCAGIVEEKPTQQGKLNRVLRKNEKLLLVERETHSSSEENIMEEFIIRKPRRPRLKLGVRIPLTNKENEEKTNQDTECSQEITFPAPPKKSWSSIAATKPKDLFKSDYETEEPPKPELLSDDVWCDSKEMKLSFKDIDGVKIEKSSDDEKVSSSQTESDDSAKVHAATAADAEDDARQVTAESDSVGQTKSGKKKSKKKKK